MNPSLLDLTCHYVGLTSTFSGRVGHLMLRRSSGRVIVGVETVLLTSSRPHVSLLDPPGFLVNLITKLCQYVNTQ